MKQKLAKLLLRLAEKLCPTCEAKPSYEAKEIAIAVAITKKNIRQYRGLVVKILRIVRVFLI